MIHLTFVPTTLPCLSPIEMANGRFHVKSFLDSCSNVAEKNIGERVRHLAFL